MATRHLSWPATIVMVEPYSRTPSFNDEVTETIGGLDYGHSYWSRPKQKYEVNLSVEPGDSQLSLLEDILQRLEGRVGRIWVREPLSRIERDVYLGVGDGSRTTFIAPWHQQSGGLLGVTAGGAPEMTSYLVYANALLTDEEAIPTSVDNMSAVVGGIITLDSSYAMLGKYSAKVDPDGTKTGYGVAWAEIPVTPSCGHTGLLWARSNTLAALKARMTWYDAGQNVVGQSSGGAITLGSGWTPIYVKANSHASAATGRLECYYDDASDKPFWVACASMGWLEDNEWWMPSMSPGVVKFAAAPSAGEEILATAEGHYFTKCQRDVVNAQSYDGAGNMTTGIKLTEVWE